MNCNNLREELHIVSQEKQRIASRLDNDLSIFMGGYTQARLLNMAVRGNKS